MLNPTTCFRFLISSWIFESRHVWTYVSICRTCITMIYTRAMYEYMSHINGLKRICVIAHRKTSEQKDRRASNAAAHNKARNVKLCALVSMHTHTHSHTHVHSHSSTGQANTRTGALCIDLMFSASACPHATLGGPLVGQDKSTCT